MMVVVDEYWRLPPLPKESLALTKAAFSVGYHQKRLKRLKKKARVVHYLAVVETSCGKTPRRGVFRKFVSGVVISRPASRTTVSTTASFPFTPTNLVACKGGDSRNSVVCSAEVQGRGQERGREEACISLMQGLPYLSASNRIFPNTKPIFVISPGRSPEIVPGFTLFHRSAARAMMSRSSNRAY